MTHRLLLAFALYLGAGTGGCGFGIGCAADPTQQPAAPASSTAGAAPTHLLQVAANRGWQDTGITVAPQQTFQLRYRAGQITDKDSKIADAHGSDYICGDPGCCEPLPDERRSALVARIGGEVFIVGNGGEYTAPAGGTIFLRVNDCDDGLLDNTGQLSVEFIPQVAEVMASDAARCAEHERFKKVDAAFHAGDLSALREAVDDADVVPNGPLPPGIGNCLEYAIYHSPVAFIRTLLEIGANPTPTDHIGFPPLIAALSCSRSQPGSPARPDVGEIMALLLEFGADPHQRGINDYTALHMAVAERNLPAIGLLLDAGADVALRTRIDDCETPREMAASAGLREVLQLLDAHQGKR